LCLGTPTKAIWDHKLSHRELTESVGGGERVGKGLITVGVKKLFRGSRDSVVVESKLVFER